MGVPPLAIEAGRLAGNPTASKAGFMIVSLKVPIESGWDQSNGTTYRTPFGR